MELESAKIWKSNDGLAELRVGHVLDVLRILPENWFHVMVTSPPYFGLRDYGLPPAVWGDGWSGCYGLEPTIEQFITHTVEVFREVRRVLREDGVAWLNLGDCYNAFNGGAGPSSSEFEGNRDANRPALETGHGLRAKGLKAGDQCLIPSRVALALQADGWFVRSTVIWSKRSPMPESIGGWRWERCRVKVANGLVCDPMVSGLKAHSGDIRRTIVAKFIDCPGCDKCRASDGYVLRKGRWRCTNSWEPIYQLTKGQWKPRVVQFADLNGEVVHLGKNTRLQESSVREPFTLLCVQFATALFDFCQRKRNFSLPPFDSEVWKQRAKDDSGPSIIDPPSVERLAVLSARLMSADISTKEFLQQLHSLWLNLVDRNEFLECWVLSLGLGSPSINADRNGTVRVNYAGEVCEVDFVHAEIVTRKPLSGEYFCDAEGVKEPATGRAPGNVSEEKRADADARNTHANTRFHKHVQGAVESRNPRAVWSLSAEPLKAKHFAAFPSTIPRRCIEASTSAAGCCPTCRSQWAPIVVKERVPTRPGNDTKVGEFMVLDPDSPYQSHAGTICGNRDPQRHIQRSRVLGYRPTCGCPEHKPVPSRVLEPFAGSGTTLMVARWLGRASVGIELSETYARDIAQVRIETPKPAEKKPKAKRRRKHKRERLLF